MRSVLALDDDLDLRRAVRSFEFAEATPRGYDNGETQARVPPPGSLRIAAFGDSFTHGDEVPNEDTWQEILMRAHPDVEAMNFGVGAYGLDQAFLHYQRDGADI